MYKLNLGKHKNVYTKKYANPAKRIKARCAHERQALFNKGFKTLRQQLA